MSTVQSIERAFVVLRALAAGPAGVTDIADRVGLPKSTVSRLLSTLEEVGAVEQVAAGGHYRIGWTMIDLSGAARPGRSLVSLARPLLAAQGHLLAWKREGDGWDAELATAQSAFGAAAIRVERVADSALDRALLVLVSG